jgi:hypothetical protein
VARVAVVVVAWQQLLEVHHRPDTDTCEENYTVIRGRMIPAYANAK